jgi:hypothetical protein
MASIGEEQQPDGYAAEPRSLYVGAASRRLSWHRVATKTCDAPG